MSINLQELFSVNANGIKKSVIRELLKLTSNPEIISFAGGLPSPESFPVEELKETVLEVLENEPKTALQYTSTEGDTILSEELVKHSNENGMNVSDKNILITTASQQGLDLISKIFINRGDKVIVELPSYVGGLGAFNAYGADMIGISMDEEGASADMLREKLSELSAKGEKPKFIYLIPDFQNPAGVTISLKRRKEILQIAYEFDVLILEDSPYHELRFEGESVPSLYSLDDKNQVILLGTFSKILAPGFRIGWIVAHHKIINKLIAAKQSADLCSPSFSQRIMGRFLQKGHLGRNIEKIKIMYHKKRDLMIAGFEKHMPKGVSWTTPEGGLFLLVKVPKYIDTDKLFDIALKYNVAFVIGSAFHCDGSGHDTMRINFSYASEDQIEIGVKRLAKAIREYPKK
ncbi:MAG: PLP-dependent aminotransferase family protein [Candidatus Cloacimonetes bacterium]|nr:PLP-dependent aminotransferase family protein [Candidatus Cloacimonadota bacterium]MBL7107914.1 PLP-dependent aminotransferase family protein [Candidatus Cloacimonadota bacterium]